MREIHQNGIRKQEYVVTFGKDIGTRRFKIDKPRQEGRKVSSYYGIPNGLTPIELGFRFRLQLVYSEFPA